MFTVRPDKEMSKLDLVEKPPKKQDPLKEAVLLLENSSSLDQKIIKGFSANPKLKRHEENKSLEIEIEKLINSYQGSLYKESEIKNICLNYNLRFLSSKLFQGDINLEVIFQIKSFCSKNNINVEDAIRQERFMIVAPAEMFYLNNKTFIIDERDPILFYKTNDYLESSKHSLNRVYILVHKWGKDLTVFRALKGLIYRNSNNYKIWQFLKYLPLSCFLTGFSYYFCNYFSYYSVVNILSCIGILLLSHLIISFIIFLNFSKTKARNSYIEKIVSENCWDSSENLNLKILT